MYAHVYSLSLPFYCLFGTLVISSRSRQVIYLIYNIVTVFMVFSLSVSIYLLITNSEFSLTLAIVPAMRSSSNTACLQ